MAKKRIPAKLRDAVLIADNYICRACGFGGSSNYKPFLDCDHIYAESQGGETTESNLQCLCKSCNILKKNYSWLFTKRQNSATESVWSQNQKIIKSAFTMGIVQGNAAERLKKLK